MKKITALFAVTALTALFAGAGEIALPAAADWKKFGADVEVKDKSFTFKPQRNYSSIVIPFAPQTVAVGSSLTVTFKVKVAGETKLDAAGLRFGFASSSAEANKNEGYYFCLGVDTAGFSLYRKNSAPLGQLGGREPQVILLKNAKLNFNIGSNNATEIKLSLERLTDTTAMLKLYVEGELRFKHELTAESAAKPIDQLMLGIGNTVNAFQIDNFDLELE
ncbi:MAG: hypothetical protein AB7F32_00115 [Victivallaceae bacterium]